MIIRKTWTLLIINTIYNVFTKSSVNKRIITMVNIIGRILQQGTKLKRNKCKVTGKRSR
jgi:ABC-type glucose/galactose transport system permease subunit